MPEAIMKFIVKAALLWAVATLASAGQTAEAATAYRGFLACKARVLYSEELPFAPVGTWLIRATLEITPPRGNPYLATLQDWMPWQGFHQGSLLAVSAGSTYRQNGTPRTAHRIGSLDRCRTCADRPRTAAMEGSAHCL